MSSWVEHNALSILAFQLLTQSKAVDFCNRRPCCFGRDLVNLDGQRWLGVGIVHQVQVVADFVDVRLGKLVANTLDGTGGQSTVKQQLMVLLLLRETIILFLAVFSTLVEVCVFQMAIQ